MACRNCTCFFCVRFYAEEDGDRDDFEDDILDDDDWDFEDDWDWEDDL